MTGYRPLPLDTPANMSPVSDKFPNALCRTVDPDLFFPEPTQHRTIARAKEICGNCDHFVACRQFAIRNRIAYGVWGGQSEVERRKYLKDVA